MLKERKLKRFWAVLLSSLLAVVAALAPSVAHADPGSSDETSFEYVSAHSTPQRLQFGEYPVTLYVAQLSYDSTYRMKKVMFYGEFDMPYTAQDIGIETPLSKDLLPVGSNKFTYNGFINAHLAWSPSSDKWMNTRFQAEQPFETRQDTFKITIDDVTHEITIPQIAAGVNPEPLSDAVTEHWANYTAAKDAGMLFTKDSEDAFLTEHTEATEMLTAANAGGSESPTQDQLDAQVKSFNEIATALQPQPFDRSDLEAAVKRADEVLAKNGKDAKRVEKAAHDAMQRARFEALTLINTKDLDTILVPEHQSEPPTHRTFDNAARALNQAVDEVTWQSYQPIDLAMLTTAYDAAVTHVPAAGKGFDSDARTNLLNAIDKGARALDNPVYLTADDAANLEKELTDAVVNADEVDLGEEFQIKVRYQYPMEGAISHLLYSYFEDETGEAITKSMPAKTGQEIRLEITDPLIKQFDGYAPVSFHLNSDDGSLGLVKVLHTSTGKKYVAFQALVANPELGGSLDVRYRKGEDLRFKEIPGTEIRGTESPGATGDKIQKPDVDPKGDEKSGGKQLGDEAAKQTKLKLPATGIGDTEIQLSAVFIIALAASGLLGAQRRASR